MRRPSGECLHPFEFFIILTGYLVISGVLLSACIGTMIPDINPPVVNQPTQQAAPPASGIVDIAPLLPPDENSGELIYEDECIHCHGATGMGDGDKAASLPAAPPPVGSLPYSRTVSPTRWFQVITQGRIEKLMPGYNLSLSDRQRWDTVAYLLTFGTSPDRNSRGKEVYQNNCQTCHGVDASGTENGISEMTTTMMYQRSLDDLVSVILNGKGTMRPVDAGLTDTDRVNTALYLRSLVFSRHTTTTSNNTARDMTENMQSIHGTVQNGSGGELPAGMVVILKAMDKGTVINTQRVPVGMGGQFSFEDVIYIPGRVFEVTTVYNGYTYSSSLIHADHPDEWQSADIKVFETGDDPSRIKADKVHIFFEFPRSDTMRVVQLFVLTNPTNRIITSREPGLPVITYPLPEDAFNLQFQNGTLGQRFVFTEDGVGDVQGILPGTDTQVLFSYDLPYRSEADFTITVPVAVDRLNVLLASEGILLRSRQLQETGEKTIQDSNLAFVFLGEPVCRIKYPGPIKRVAPCEKPSGKGSRSQYDHGDHCPGHCSRNDRHNLISRSGG